MDNWLGTGLMTLGIALVAAGFVKRRNRMRAPWPEGAIRPEFAAMGEMVRPLILFAVGFFALKMTLFYFVLGGQNYLSPLDFSGILFVLAAYAFYVVLATTKPVVAAEPGSTEMRSAA